MFEPLIAYFRGLARRRAIGAELDEEMQFHLDQHIATNVQRGISPAEATRMARLEFGGLAQTREAVGDVRATWIDAVWRDVRLAVRLLRKERTFTMTVGATLAVCLGANVALFAIVDRVLLRPLPIPASDRVVITGNRYPKAGVDSGYSTSAGDYVDRLRETNVFEEQALFKPASRSVEENGVPTRVQAMSVTPSFFRLARVAPRLGRTFTDDETEPGHETRALLSFALWQSQFGADPAAVGRDLRIDGRPYTIIGVMPKAFALVVPDVLVWTPLTLAPAQRTAHYNDVWGYIARLNANASVEQAQAEIDEINRANLDRFPQSKQAILDTGFHTVVDGLQDSLVRDVRPTLRLLWGGALFVLLIGCLNVANLVLARTRARTKELATRLALGAGPGQIARQLITESVVLTLGSAAAGLMIGWAGLRALGALNLQDLPGGADIPIDARIVVFTIGTSIVIGILLGVLPLAAVPATPTAFLNGEQRSTTVGPSARRLRRGLVVAQVAFAFVLLLGAGLLFASFRRVLAIDAGFQSDHVLTASIALPASRYPDEPQARRFAEDVLTRVRTVPSVAAAGVTDTIPLGSYHTNSLILAEGYQMTPGESFIAPARVVASSGYMEAMHARLVAGRLFNDHDVDAAPSVVIVDQTLAARFWPGASAIGQRMYRPEDDLKNLLAMTPTTRMFTVVGVIAPMKLNTLVDTGASAGAYYFPIAQQPSRMLTVAVRTSGDPEMVARMVRDAIQSVDRELPVFDLQPMGYWTAKSLASRHAAMLLSLIFSAVALFLAAVGIYGVLAYGVAQRRKEIGIRLALGASTRAVFALVMREGVIVIAVGLGLGAIGVAGLQRALQSQLFGIAVTDPVVLIAVTGLLASVAATACAAPAWRASHIDPRVALSE